MKLTFPCLPCWQTGVLGACPGVTHFAVKAIFRAGVARAPRHHPRAELGPGG